MTTLSKLSISLTILGVMACGGCQTFTSSTAQGASTSETPTAHRGPEVEVVRNGILTGYNTTTVGKAFEGTFQNPKWTSFVSPKGVTVVEFNGTIKMKALQDGAFKIKEGNEVLNPLVTNCMGTLGLTEQMTQEANKPTDGGYGGGYGRLPVLYWVVRQKDTHPEWYEKLDGCVNIPVSFQFTLSADQKTFNVAYVDESIFGDQEDKALAFIYH